jgi:hypothetical protein
MVAITLADNSIRIFDGEIDGFILSSHISKSLAKVAMAMKINGNQVDLSTKISQEIIILESDNSKGEIGTFKFVAEAFNLKIENAVRIFIILIVIVFDPLAVALVIAYNNLALNKKETIQIEKIIEKPVEKIKEVFHEYKRGTKRSHNPDLADPNIED